MLAYLWDLIGSERQWMLLIPQLNRAKKICNNGFLGACK